jgi:hypothetical protein
MRQMSRQAAKRAGAAHSAGCWLTQGGGWRRGEQAFEDMDPEQLMSGYHLAGGAHPGQHLGSARRSWFQRHLADVHRQSGSVLGNGGDEHLRQKRAQITKQLLQLGGSAVVPAVVGQAGASLPGGAHWLPPGAWAMRQRLMCRSSERILTASAKARPCTRVVVIAGAHARPFEPGDVTADARGCEQPQRRTSGGGCRTAASQSG